MSKVITIRRVSDNKLMSFGPDNEMYDPGVGKDCVKQIEPDYNTVVMEWVAAQPPVVDRVKRATDDPLVPQWFKDYIG